MEAIFQRSELEVSEEERGEGAGAGKNSMSASSWFWGKSFLPGHFRQVGRTCPHRSCYKTEVRLKSSSPRHINVHSGAVVSQVNAQREVGSGTIDDSRFVKNDSVFICPATPNDDRFLENN